MELELRHLRALCSIAEAGSISRAAARMHISQPSLTAQLRRIERAIGGELFRRGPSGVEPTALGQFVLGRAHAVLASMDALALGARRQSDTRTRLRLGAAGAAFLGLLLPRLRAGLPHREVTLHVEPSFAALTQLLGAGVVDTVLLTGLAGYHPALPPDTTERTLIAGEPALVALPAHHPLATAAEVELADLAGEEWILGHGNEDAGLEVLREACGRAGFEPIIAYPNLDALTAAQIIANGEAVTWVLPTFRPPPGVAVRPLAGQPLRFRRVLLWHRARVSADEAEFLQHTISEVYREIVPAHAATV